MAHRPAAPRHTLKNHGCHLEHSFGHDTRYLLETYFVPGLLAFLMHPTFELVDVCVAGAGRVQLRDALLHLT